MKVTMLGHASLFVETDDCNILMDPILWDPFCEGLNESCPKREVKPENIPEYDFLVISHRHLDHFDVRSLAYLPKDVDVLVPKDKLIVESLRKLGYSRIYTLKDFEQVTIGSTSLMTTRSEWRVPEFGMVFADASGVFWNTVDSHVSGKTVSEVRKKYPVIDFLLTSWQISLEDNYQYNRPISFPYVQYGEMFSLLNRIRPRAIAPGAQGWKYVNESAWLNQIVFSTTREQFCQDVATAFPEISDNIFTLDPGDVFIIEQEGLQHLPGSSDCAVTLEDDRHLIDFAPVKVNNELVDSNPKGYPLEVLKDAIAEEVEHNLPQFIQDNQDSIFQTYADWPVIYQLEIMFPDGSQTWCFDFSQSVVSASRGRNPLANCFAYITASSLYSLMQQHRDWDYLMCSGEYRAFHKVYSISRLGIIPAHASAIRDPIQAKFSSDYIAHGNIEVEIEGIIGRHGQPQPAGKDKNPMLKFGSSYYKFVSAQRSHAAETASGNTSSESTSSENTSVETSTVRV